MAPQIILMAVAAVISVATAAPEPAVTILGQESPNPVFALQDPGRAARILRLESGSTPEGAFSYTYETENGISARAEGSVTKGADPDQDIQRIKGQYSYTGPDGVLYSVQYIADENGFQALGEHLPTPPPIPEAIHRALDHNAAHPEEDNSIVAASPALAPTPVLSPAAVLAPKILASAPTFGPPLASPIPIALPDPFPTKLPPRVVATSRAVPTPTVNTFNTLVSSTPVPPTRSPDLPTLPKQTQQLAQAQLLAQTQLLQQQQLQQQLQQQFQQQHVQAQQLQPNQFQLQSLQPQQFQSQQFSPQLLQPQQFQLQQLQPQSLQPQQFTSQQLQPQQLQPQQLQPQQFQFPQLQSQGVPNQFTPTFQTYESQRRSF